MTKNTRVRAVLAALSSTSNRSPRVRDRLRCVLDILVGLAALGSLDPDDRQDVRLAIDQIREACSQISLGNL